MVKLSILIPYYQTYELTERLIKELITQKTDEVEIIIIDDGCNEKRLDQYDKEIKVIHLEENKGVSYARNTGIKEATGEYVAFIDSDDMIMMDYVSQLIKLINERKEQVIIFNWLDISTNDVIRLPENCAVWKAIYKKELIPLFDESLRVREDYFFQQELEKKDYSKYYFDRVLYIYNSNRQGSLWWNETKGKQ